MNGMSLEEALLAVLGNGLMGVVVFYAWNKLEGWFAWLASADIELKRVGVALLSFVAVQAPFWFGVLMFVLPEPADWRAWLSETFFYASVAFLSATLTHGAAKGRAS